MKKVALALLLGVAVFLIFVFVNARKAALIMSWNDLAPIKADQIEGYVRIYKMEEGLFPSSLDEMATNASFSCRGNLENILSQSNAFQYGYRLNTNGFIIIVSHPTGQNQDFRKIVRDCPLNSAPTNSDSKK
jgi:hypothetical protein